jgi:hypothetical protein
MHCHRNLRPPIRAPGVHRALKAGDRPHAGAGPTPNAGACDAV